MSGSVPSNLTPRVRRAVHTTLKVTEKDLLRFGPSPEGTEKGSLEHKAALEDLTARFDEKNWLKRDDLPEGQDEFLPIGLEGWEMGTVITALTIVTELMIVDEVRRLETDPVIQDHEKKGLDDRWKAVEEAREVYLKNVT